MTAARTWVPSETLTPPPADTDRRYLRTYRALCHLYHPAVAAVLAAEAMSYAARSRRPVASHHRQKEAA